MDNVPLEKINVAETVTPRPRRRATQRCAGHNSVHEHRKRILRASQIIYYRNLVYVNRIETDIPAVGSEHIPGEAILQATSFCADRPFRASWPAHITYIR